MHTKGPWKKTGDSYTGRYITVKSDNGRGRTVARIPFNSPKEANQGIYTDNDDANLIAAAPELLEALRDALTILNSRAEKLGIQKGGPVIDKIEVAIKKANP